MGRAFRVFTSGKAFHLHLNMQRTSEKNFIEFLLTIEGCVALMNSIAGPHAKERMSPAVRSIAENTLMQAKTSAFVHSLSSTHLSL